MASIKKTALYFWSEETVMGMPCEACKVDIYGTSYVPVMQVGEVIELRFKDIDLRLCESCYSKLPEDKK